MFDKNSLLLVSLLVAAALVLSGCTILAGSQSQPRPSIDNEEVEWLEISPLLSVTTYVDDYAIICQVVDLINGAVLQPVPESDIAQILQGQPDPEELIVNGTAYPRNIRVELIRTADSGYEHIASVHFFGEYLGIGEQYFFAEKITDAFIAVLDELFSQGLGKGAIE